jgi:hypothetical protein
MRLAALASAVALPQLQLNSFKVLHADDLLVLTVLELLQGKCVFAQRRRRYL